MRGILVALPILLIGVDIFSSNLVHASPWTLPKGGVYVYTGFFWTRSEHFFNADSDRIQFLNNGTSQVYGFSFDGSYGVTNWFMLSGSLPILWYKLEDNLILDEGRSFGDMRVSARLRTPFYVPFTAAIEGGVKFPTASTKDPTRAQIGEGQYDFELMGSVGKVLPLWGVRASLDLGHRWRQRNTDTGFKPGNEFIYRMELSYEVTRKLSVNSFLNGLEGSEGNAKVFGITSSTFTERDIAALNPNISYRLDKNFELILSANIPLDGKRFYAGKQIILGVAFNRNDLNTAVGINGFANPSGGGCCQIQ